VLEADAGHVSALTPPARRDAERAARATTPTPAEPRPEIWFKRRVHLRESVRELWRSRELIRALAERDLRTRYKQSLLGVAWVALGPISLMLVFTLVFTRLGYGSTNGAPYPLFVLIGLIPWTFFSASVLTGGMSLTANTPLLNKLYCPREVFPLATIVAAGVDALVSTLVLAALFAIEGYAPTREIYYAPIMLLILATCTFGITLAVAGTAVYIQDIRVALPIAIQIGFFVTPVAYSTDLVASSRKVVMLYSALDPLVPVIDGLRRVVLFGQSPDWMAELAGGSSALLFVVVGFVLFKRLETGIADFA
jgi:ABC-type polysaccharide/polyol phosphate export permease